LGVNLLQQTDNGGHNPIKTAYALNSGQSLLARAYSEAAGWAEINWLPETTKFPLGCRSSLAAAYTSGVSKSQRLSEESFRYGGVSAQ